MSVPDEEDPDYDLFWKETLGRLEQVGELLEGAALEPCPAMTMVFLMLAAQEAVERGVPLDALQGMFASIYKNTEDGQERVIVHEC